MVYNPFSFVVDFVILLENIVWTNFNLIEFSMSVQKQARYKIEWISINIHIQPQLWIVQVINSVLYIVLIKIPKKCDVKKRT